MAGGLGAFLTGLSHRYGERPAVGHLGQTLSYTELDVLSRRFATWLQQHTDLQPGDRLAIQLPNSMQYLVVLFGALRAGLVVVNTNPLYTPQELEWQLNDSGARALVLYEGFARQTERILERTPVRWLISSGIGDLHRGWRGWLLNGWMQMRRERGQQQQLRTLPRLRQLLRPEAGAHWRDPGCRADDLALLQYTGGTTGLPKGAMLSHRCLLANIDQLHRCLQRAGISTPQRVLQPLPLYHIYSFTLVQVMLSLGSQIELIPDPRNLKRLARAFERFRPTLFAGINPLFIALCQYQGFTRLDFASLQLTISGGMALTESAARRWQTVTGCPIIEGYGLTECSPVVSVGTPGHEHLGTVGRPLPDTRIRIVDDQGRELPAGENGEIQVQGPQLMQGYWGHPEETAQVLQDGWLATGDIGRIDERGELRIIDRRKEMINVSGFKVYPSELENLISGHPDILECAVIGLPDETSGESIHLFVVSNNPRLSSREVRDYCRERLTSYKVPRSIEFCRDLPRSPIGKVQRRLLRERVLREGAGRG